MKYISQSLGVPYATLRNLWQRHNQNPSEGLKTRYHHCGSKAPGRDNLIYRASLWLRRLHPDWGAPLIRLHLAQRYGEESVVHLRTLQRWFLSSHLSKPRQLKAEPAIGQSKAVHNIWQVDAKERLRLLDGQQACYLTIVDEKSGACLEAPVFPLCAYQPGAHRGRTG